MTSEGDRRGSHQGAVAAPPPPPPPPPVPRSLGGERVRCERDEDCPCERACDDGGYCVGASRSSNRAGVGGGGGGGMGGGGGWSDPLRPDCTDHGDCPGGECCSPYGYCGEGPAYCDREVYGECDDDGDCEEGGMCCVGGRCVAGGEYCGEAEVAGEDAGNRAGSGSGDSLSDDVGNRAPAGDSGGSRCSADRPCASDIGNSCCSKWGHCGYSEAHCGADSCVGGCWADRAAECDKDKPCPGGACCSERGHCGRTYYHCSLELKCQSQCWGSTGRVTTTAASASATTTASASATTTASSEVGTATTATTTTSTTTTSTASTSTAPTTTSATPGRERTTTTTVVSGQGSTTAATSGEGGAASTAATAAASTLDGATITTTASGASSSEETMATNMTVTPGQEATATTAATQGGSMTTTTTTGPAGTVPAANATGTPPREGSTISINSTGSAVVTTVATGAAATAGPASGVRVARDIPLQGGGTLTECLPPEIDITGRTGPSPDLVGVGVDFRYALNVDPFYAVRVDLSFGLNAAIRGVESEVHRRLAGARLDCSRVRRRELQAGESGEAYPSAISTEKDDARSDDACLQEEAAPGFDCTVVDGGVTAYFSNATQFNETEVRADYLRTIRDIIASFDNETIPGVRGVAFRGPPSQQSDSGTDFDTLSNDGSTGGGADGAVSGFVRGQEPQGNSPGGVPIVGWVFIAIGINVLILLAFYLIRRRRGEVERTSNERILDSEDEESGSKDFDTHEARSLSRLYQEEEESNWEYPSSANSSLVGGSGGRVAASLSARGGGASSAYVLNDTNWDRNGGDGNGDGDGDRPAPSPAAFSDVRPEDRSEVTKEEKRPDFVSTLDDAEYSRGGSVRHSERTMKARGSVPGWSSGRSRRLGEMGGIYEVEDTIDL